MLCGMEGMGGFSIEKGGSGILRERKLPQPPEMT